MLLRSKDY